jgi:hypothetical protein
VTPDQTASPYQMMNTGPLFSPNPPTAPRPS